MDRSVRDARPDRLGLREREVAEAARTASQRVELDLHVDLAVLLEVPFDLWRPLAQKNETSVCKL